jgi:hypothetical protein
MTTIRTMSFHRDSRTRRSGPRLVVLPLAFFAVAAIGGLALTAAVAGAQQMRVSVTHAAAQSKQGLDANAFHWKPGSPYRDSLPGLPPTVVLAEVAASESVCYVVHGANPLLYTYSATAVDVPVAPNADLAKIAEQIGSLITTMSANPQVKGLVFSPRADTVKATYQGLVRILAVDYLKDAARIRRESDGFPSFAVTFARDTALWSRVKTTDAAAEQAYDELKKAGVEASVADIRSLQKYAFDNLRHAHEQVETAANLMQPGHEALQVCKPMLKGRTRFGLLIKPRADAAPVVPARRVSADKEELAAFTIDPQYTERFRVAPGLFVAGGFSGDRNVGVADGKLTVEPTGRTYTRTGMAAMARATKYIWPTIAVAKGDGATVDLFAGLQLRAGNLVFGPDLSVGVGVAWMEVPIGAKGLRAGDPVPNETKLENIISRERQFGLGVTFTITGLNLGGDKSATSSK